nr:uncharacterized protein LOC113828224 [Penaeus vannamei]
MLGDDPEGALTRDSRTSPDGAMPEAKITDKPRTSAGARAGGADKDPESLSLADDMMSLMKEEAPAVAVAAPEETRVSAAASAPASTERPVAPAPRRAGASGSAGRLIKVTGLRVEQHSKGISYEDFAGSVLAGADAHVRLFGVGLTMATELQFTANEGEYGDSCSSHTTPEFKVTQVGDGWAVAVVRLPVMSSEQRRWYLCVKDHANVDFYHQGSASWLTMTSYNLLLPLWIQVLLLLVLLILSGLVLGAQPFGLMATRQDGAQDRVEHRLALGTPLRPRHRARPPPRELSAVHAPAGERPRQLHAHHPAGRALLGPRRRHRVHGRHRRLRGDHFAGEVHSQFSFLMRIVLKYVRKLKLRCNAKTGDLGVFSLNNSSDLFFPVKKSMSVRVVIYTSLQAMLIKR